MYYPYKTPSEEAYLLTQYLIPLKNSLVTRTNNLESRIIGVAATPKWQTIPAIQLMLEAVYPAHNDDVLTVADCLRSFEWGKHGLTLQSKDGGRGHTVYRLIPTVCVDQVGEL